MKLVKATFEAGRDEPLELASVLLEFDDGRLVMLDSDIKRSLLDEGLVYLGFEDLPATKLVEGSHLIEIPGLTHDENVLNVARLYAGFLDGRESFSDGDLLFP